MSRTISTTKTVYKFNELDDGAKQNALEDYALNGLDYDWWDCQEERLKEDMEEIGITVDKMYFSGFYTQGSGACFEGHVDDWPKFLWETGLWQQYLRCFANADELGRMEWTTCGNCPHENSLEFNDWELVMRTVHQDQDWTQAEGGIAQETFNDYTEKQFRQELEDLPGEVEQIVKDTCHQLYKDLQEDWEYLTSMEAFEETCEANDWEFEEDGSLA